MNCRGISYRLVSLLAAIGLVCSMVVLGAHTARVARATALNVTRFDDPIPGGCDPGDCSLREAILAANASAGHDTIALPGGTYVLAQAGSDDTASLGDLDITDDVTITGAGAATTIITTTMADRIFHIPSTANVSIADVTISGGHFAVTGDGAGLLNNGGTLTVTNSIFSSNHAIGLGGGLYNITGTVVISSTTFAGNTATSVGGGLAFDDGTLRIIDGAFLDNTADTSGAGVAIRGGTTTIDGSTFAGGETISGGGGGISIASGVVTITNSMISGNSASSGGGISTSGTLTIIGSTISDNTTISSGGGGGIANQFGTLTIIDSTISGNTTGGGGGGIRIFNGVVTITGSTISHNTATAFASGGGGISNSSTSSSSLRLINSTISGNTAQAGGGALSNNSASAMTSLFNVTITNNTTSDGNGGGVVIISGVVTATNSLIAGNIDSGGQAPDCSGALTSAGHNLIGSTSFCNISGMTTGNLLGLDPLLGPLQDNGGATLTHALSSGSPAIDAGDPAGCKDDTGATLTIDQRSFPRPVGSGCDIGAWEQGQANLSLTLSDSPDPVTVGDPLVYSITIANNGPHTATAVLVSDALPSAVSLNALSASQGSCSQSGQDISCELGVLAVSATASVTLTVTAVSAGSISNTASVASNEADTSLENNSDSETTTLNPSSNLSLVKSAAPDPAIVGAPMTYTLQVVNGASPVNGVVLTDTLPAAFSLRSVSTTSGSCSGSETIVCTIGSLAADATATVTIVGEPAAQGTLINTAVITGTPDSDPGNNSSSTSTTVSTLADLSVTQSDDPDPVGTGMPLTYTLTILNAGPSPATGIVLTDTLPFGVVFEAATTSQGSCSGTSTITCALDSLDSGASATVTIRVTASQFVGTITNIVRVGAHEADPDTSNNSATESTSLTPAIDLVISQSDSLDPVVVASPLVYTIVVTNQHELVTATGVTVVDTLPPGVVLVSATASQGTCSGTSTVTCSLGSLENNASATITITVTPSAVGSITNSASVEGNEFDPEPSNNSSSEATEVSGFVIFLPLIQR